jgi:hypothetical protein
VVSEIVVSRAKSALHTTVENGPKFSTGVEDTPTISRVLALSGTRYIVVGPVTSGKSTTAFLGAFSKVFGIPSGNGVSTGPDFIIDTKH